jgi:hypothetical protein
VNALRVWWSAWMFRGRWVSREVSGDKFRNFGKWNPKSKQG